MPGEINKQEIKVIPANVATDPVITAASKYPPLTAMSTGAVPAVNAETSGTGVAIFGRSKVSDGVHGESSGSGMSGVTGIHDSGGNGVYGRSSGNAGCFDGNVQVNGNVNVTGDVALIGADCAEHFDVTSSAALIPGDVVVIGRDGRLERSTSQYDHRAAGVVAAAGNFRPGILLDAQPESSGDRAAISLLGKAFCFADAGFGEIMPGDLLTTSDTPGHAMKATDQARSVGSIIGKALGSLTHGTGLVPMLVTLK